ncbi:MAG: hypothetical protein ABIM42_01770 [candidate division WOR-3 bacterium]
MFFILLLFSIANSVNEDFNFYSLRALSTAYLMRGVEEAVQNPSYLYLLPNSHFVTNFSDFSIKSLFLGGNITSSLLREGALFYLSNTNRPLRNTYGNLGFTRKDTTEIVDTNGNNVPDLIKYREIQTDGYQKDFFVKFIASFQFVGDGWFAWASFLKDEKKTEVETPGDPLNPLGYFEFKEIVTTYPDSGFSGLTIASGDCAEIRSKNKTGGSLGGGIILGDTSYITISLGYRKIEDINSRGAYYSFRVKPDTLTLVLLQQRHDSDETYNGYDLNTGFEYLVKGQGLERIISLSYSKTLLSPDTIWCSFQDYSGRFVNVTDTLFSSFESLDIHKIYKVSSKPKVANRLAGNFSQVVSIGKDVKLAFGVRGLYYYEYSSFSLKYNDSISVSFNDGDTVRNDVDDYERSIFSRGTGTQWNERKCYTIQFPFGIEVNPFNLKGVYVRAGSVFSIKNEEESFEKSYNPIGGQTEIVIYGDSTRISTSRPISGFREKGILSTQGFTLDHFVGTSLEMSRNLTFDMVFHITQGKIQNIKAGFVIKF